MDNKKFNEFLSKIDELSKNRLERIDVVLEIHKYNFSMNGYDLTELSCINGKSVILRGSKGFFVYPGKALNSGEEYQAYLDACDFLEEKKEDFKIVNNLIVEKEKILDGLYQSDYNTADMNNLITSLGYGEIRNHELKSNDKRNCKEEFNRVKELLTKLDNDPNAKFLDACIKEQFDHVKKAIKPGYYIELKNERKKYDTDFDNYTGVVLIDKEIGNINLLYGSDGFEVHSNISPVFIDENYDFLEVYLKIITKALFKLVNLD